MSDPNLIELTPADVARCYEFAEVAYENATQSFRQFGGEDLRSYEEFVADQVEGKLTEIALERFLAKQGLLVELDFEHYGDKLHVDNGDIKHLILDGKRVAPLMRLDVKGTTQGRRWLLVEDHKFISDLYVLIRFLDLPGKEEARQDPRSLLDRGYSAVAVGWATNEDFLCPETNRHWFRYGKGQFLMQAGCAPQARPESMPELERYLDQHGRRFTTARLDAPVNYGLPDHWLRTDWANLVHRLTLGVNPPQPGTGGGLAAALEAVTPAYSLAVFPGPEPLSAPALEQVLLHLRRGVKVLLVCEQTLSDERLAPFLDSGLLALFRPSRANSPRPAHPVVVPDGSYTAPGVEELLKALDQQHEPATAKGAPFNFRQYGVIHAPREQHLCILADAGTGKTATMVDRVLFLLHTVDGLHPREIVMITFTRDAAHEMRKRLREALVVRYQATRNRRYLDLMEQLSEMTIKTIHAYSKELLKSLGSILGYGRNVRIQEFRQERRRILERLISQYVSGPERVREILKVRVYEFLEIADTFWTEMENKGLSSDEITGLSWGDTDKASASLQDIFCSLFIEAEEQFTALKQNTNSISLKDMTRSLERVRSEVTDLRSQLPVLPKFIFIDEFQDTDDTQVRLAAWLQTELKAALFVVGDIKQSIYRFRGATHVAFDTLTKALESRGTTLAEKHLVRNYRTDKALLDDMVAWFKAWGDARRKWLTYHSDLEIESAHPGGVPVRTERVTKDTVEATVKALIQEAWDRRQEKEQIALIVRTNAQAQRIRKWCEALGLECQVETGGDFYKTDAVRDFLRLTAGLLFPEDAAARLNLHRSPYSAVAVPWQAIVQEEGNPQAITALLNDFPPHPDWADFQRELRLKPVLSVLRSIISACQPAHRVFQKERDRLTREHANLSGDEVTRRAEGVALRYSRNLNKLLQILRETFSSESVTLHAIYAFVSLKRATDRQEDQVALTEAEETAPLLCKTVHKAKGQQFGTVIIPFTDQPFSSYRSEILLEPILDNGQQVGWQVGWRVRGENRTEFSNDLYTPIRRTEDDEARREETRLLYVAMTRAKHQLWIATCSARNCWGELLQVRN